ncbi:hypothetical protein MPLB_1680064 [Mesorhizobium sp. ORS 3324]|nr:hypothetical protein MPLB_1680064 [Mesorhizobium sp. ORS 3324]CDX43539.1 hypothetical protein MPLA_670105 [Mesorhizobium sp. ORS 3359]
MRLFRRIGTTFEALIGGCGKNRRDKNHAASALAIDRTEQAKCQGWGNMSGLGQNRSARVEPFPAALDDTPGFDGDHALSPAAPCGRAGGRHQAPRCAQSTGPPAGQLILNKQMKVVNTWTSVRDYRRTKSGGRSKTIQRSVSTISPPDWVYRKRNWSPRIAVWARFVSSRASMIC